MRITVQVTQEDIKDGRRAEACWCPIALAMRRAGFYLPVVDSETAFVGPMSARSAAELPQEAQRFVNDFDERKKVSPFAFEIEVPSTAAPGVETKGETA